MRLTVPALALLAAAATAASGHEWYPVRCCSGSDCRVAPDGEIVETRGGWRVIPTGEFYRYDQAPPSPDGKFHRCLRDPKNVASPTICIFAPIGGS